jgi:hypothetical protein
MLRKQQEHEEKEKEKVEGSDGRYWFIVSTMSTKQMKLKTKTKYIPVHVPIQYADLANQITKLSQPPSTTPLTPDQLPRSANLSNQITQQYLQAQLEKYNLADLPTTAALPLPLQMRTLRKI